MNFNCPKCNDKMENGFVTTARSICWMDDCEKHIFSVNNLESLSGTIWRLKLPKCEALRCKKCKIVIFNYESN